MLVVKCTIGDGACNTGLELRQILEEDRHPLTLGLRGRVIRLVVGLRVIHELFVHDLIDFDGGIGIAGFAAGCGHLLVLLERELRDFQILGAAVDHVHIQENFVALGWRSGT